MASIGEFLQLDLREHISNLPALLAGIVENGLITKRRGEWGVDFQRGRRRTTEALRRSSRVLVESVDAHLPQLYSVNRDNLKH